MTLSISDVTSKKLSLLSLLSAILVVFLHAPRTDTIDFSYWVERFVGGNLASVAVPFFFVASGFLLGQHVGEGGWYGKALKKRVKTLLIPYLIWCVILGMVANFDSLIANAIHHQPLMRYICLDPIRIFGLDPRYTPAMPLWFLRELVLLILISPIVLAILRRGKCISLLFFVVLLGLGCTTVPAGYADMMTFTFSPVNLLSFSIGMYLAVNPVRVMPNLFKMSFVLGAGLMVLNTFSPLLFTDSNICVLILLRNIAIMFLLIGAWGLCPAVNLPQLLKGQQFPIYLLHPIFLTLPLVSKNIFPQFTLSVFGYIVFVCISIVCSIVVSRFLRNRFSNVANVLFGGRK